MISIVIVNWNSGQLLERCVRSVLQHAAGCEIVIVDNASVDFSLRFAAGIGRDLIILRNTRNVGFAAGNNTGWRKCKGDKILFLNPDTECLPESIGFLEQTLSKDRAVWAAGGQLINAAGRSRSGFNVREFPRTKTVAADMLLINEIWPSNPWSGTRHADSNTFAVDVDQPAAACLMVTRAALDSIRGFDESFRPAWFEDVDLCRRIRNQGGRIQYQPRARFLHHGGYSLEYMSRQEFLEIFHTNQIRYFKKHHGLKTAVIVRRLIVSGLILRSALSLARSPAPHISRIVSARMYWNAARHISMLREVAL